MGSSVASTASSSVNTYPVVTTTAQQVVPSTPSSATGGIHTTHVNIPGLVVGLVAGLIVATLVAYKLYVYVYRRRQAKNSAPLPEARAPLAGQPSPGMSQVWGNPSSEGELRTARSMAFSDNWGGSSSSLAAEREYSNSSLGAFTPVPSGSGANTPTSPTSPGRGGSPDGYAHDSVGRLGTTSPWDRGSISMGQRRAYGKPFSGAPQLKSLPSSTRLSGAPHSPHSRIGIIAPLPLAPPPGAVISTDKSTLGFAPSSGIGDAPATGSRDHWFTSAGGSRERTPDHIHQSQRNSTYDGTYSESQISPREPHSSRSTSSPGASQHSFPPSPTSANGPDPTRLSPTSPVDKVRRELDGRGRSNGERDLEAGWAEQERRRRESPGGPPS